MALTHSRPFEAHVFDESPWYAPFACLTGRLRGLDDFPAPEQLSALYAERIAGSDAPRLAFVAAAPRARRRGQPIELASLYEGRIVLAGEVPTRLADWHDLFNALAFCAFPRAKWALHARQFRIYEARLVPGATRLPGARTREQDALALFDEGGVVICSKGPRAALPADPDRVDTALTELVRSGEACALLFGHALFEHLAAGLPPPLGYAHVLELDVEQAALAHPGGDAAAQLALLDAVDRALGAALADPREFAEPERARGLSLPALLAEAP
jgi:hypothetical protein